MKTDHSKPARKGTKLKEYILMGGGEMGERTRTYDMAVAKSGKGGNEQ
jgi:hypothetical protein